MTARDTVDKVILDARGALAWRLLAVADGLARVAHRLDDAVPDADTRVAEAFILGVDAALHSHGLPRERRTIDPSSRRAAVGVELRLVKS